MSIITEVKRSIISGEHKQLARLTHEDKIVVFYGCMGSGKTQESLLYLYDVEFFSRLLPTTEQVHTVVIKDPIDDRTFIDSGKEAMLEKIIWLLEDRYRKNDFSGCHHEMIQDIISYLSEITEIFEETRPEPRLSARYLKHLAVESDNKLDKFKEVFLPYRNSPNHYFIFDFPDAMFSRWEELEEIIYIANTSTNATLLFDLLDMNFRAEPFSFKDGKGSFEDLKRHATRIVPLTATCDSCLDKGAEFTIRLVSYNGKNPHLAPIYDKLIRVGGHKPISIPHNDILARGHEGEEVSLRYGASHRYEFNPEGKEEWIYYKGIYQKPSSRDRCVIIPEANEKLLKRYPQTQLFALEEMLHRFEEENLVEVIGDKAYSLG